MESILPLSIKDENRSESSGFLHIGSIFAGSTRANHRRLYTCEPNGSRGVFLRRLNTDDFANETEKHPDTA